MTNTNRSNLPAPGQIGKAVRTEAELKMVYVAMERAIWKSFAEDKARAKILLPTHSNPTQSMVNERFTICVDYLAIVRNELGFTLDRALAKMHQFLRCTLDKIPVDLKAWQTRGYFTE